ncbi:alpha/beta fold hydrolase [Bacteroidetes bacterium endosymbiont of Geopemphigus sp.]|uniref:alpha/beta fold hydrolase n=1 Tax=Bacteroidetes bacterium endosymbiont of Geopemphigus sp. TaxID=2047937 RepID=UPI0018A876EC|nr:alpha/beta hydrolase [Bacteroidetes bacterium endosymbiont of Geopemphigus sp.]
MIFSLKKEKTYTYVEEGEGHTFVLLHGLMGNLSNFNAPLKFFSTKGYKVIIPSLPLYSMPLLRTNISNLAKHIMRFLRDRNFSKVTLVGNSLGGHIALIVAREIPNMVHSITLTGSSGLFEKAFGDSFPKRGSYQYIEQKTQEVFYDPKVATKELVDEVYEIVSDRNKALKTLHIARSALKNNMADELLYIKQPVCLIWGKQDNVTPPEVAEEFHRLLPCSDLFWIDKCGHAPMMERPESFVKILDEWISKFNLNHEYSKH